MTIYKKGIISLLLQYAFQIIQSKKHYEGLSHKSAMEEIVSVSWKYREILPKGTTKACVLQKPQPISPRIHHTQYWLNNTAEHQSMINTAPLKWLLLVKQTKTLTIFVHIWYSYLCKLKTKNLHEKYLSIANI